MTGRPKLELVELSWSACLLVSC